MSERVLARVLALALSLSCVSSGARAEDLAGAFSTGLAIRAGSTGGNDPQLGGVMLLDVWYPRGSLRLGGTTGVFALFGDRRYARIVAPMMLSLAVETMGPRVGFSIRLRGGLWAGATDDGLRAGCILSGGLFMHVAITERIAFALGADTMFTFGHGDFSLFVPTISVVYRPGASADEP